MCHPTSRVPPDLLERAPRAMPGLPGMAKPLRGVKGGYRYKSDTSKAIGMTQTHSARELATGGEKNPKWNAEAERESPASHAKAGRLSVARAAKDRNRAHPHAHNFLPGRGNSKGACSSKIKGNSGVSAR